MSDYEAIRNLLGSYAQSVDARPRNPDRIVSHYVEDCSFTDVGVTISPRTKLKALFEAARTAEVNNPKLSGKRHMQVNSVINVDGNHADATTQLIVLDLNAEHGWRVSGCYTYTDDIVRDHDGQWKFKSRTLAKDESNPANPAREKAQKDFFKSIMAAP